MKSTNDILDHHEAGNVIIDCIIFIQKHTLDARSFENFPTVTLRPDFDNRSTHIKWVLLLISLALSERKIKLDKLPRII